MIDVSLNVGPDIATGVPPSIVPIRGENVNGGPSACRCIVFDYKELYAQIQAVSYKLIAAFDRFCNCGHWYSYIL